MVVLHRPGLSSFTVGHRSAEQHPVALLGLSQSGAANPGGTVVQHPGRADLCSAVPGTGVANPHASAADPDSWADCNPWTGYSDACARAMPSVAPCALGTDPVRYRLVLWHHSSGSHGCESQYHEPEPDLRRLDVVHSVELRSPQNSSTINQRCMAPCGAGRLEQSSPRSVHWSVTQLKPTKAVFCVTLTPD